MKRTQITRTRFLVAAVAASAAVLFAVARPHLIDDTYITLSYARNLAFHGHWGLIADATSNTATSPLNVLALAGITFVVRDAVLAAGALFVVCQVLALLALRRIGAALDLPVWFPPLTIAALMVNPLLISSLGLEIALTTTGLCWLLACLLERRPFATGVSAGLVALTRLDLVVFVLLLFFGRKRFWEGAGRTVLGAVAVTLPWFGFSWLVLGAAVPDTLVIKTLQGAQDAWGGWEFSDGPVLYFQEFPWQAALAFAPLLLAAAVADGRSRFPLGVFALAGVAHYLVYSGLGVPPYHWYYAPVLIAATVFACAHARPAVVVLVAASVFAFAFTPKEFAPITSNYAATADYARIGRELGALAGDRTVGSHGEIGVLAYHCECAIIDVFSDRGRLREAVRDRLAFASPVERALLDANFTFADDHLSPRRLDLVLVRASEPPPDALAHWEINAPMLGHADLYLRPAG